MNAKLLPSWRLALNDLVTDADELLQLLEIERGQLPHLDQITKDFRLRVPRSFIKRMQKGNPQDPLLLQILPTVQELNLVPGYTHDPLEETKANPVPGLLHKYQGRVLITLTGACGIHCRYCFRRHFPYHENNPLKENWPDIFNYLQQDPTIKEVLISGGDPLVLGDHVLKAFTQQLARIEHIKRLRIHSRLPIVLPERIDAALLRWMADSSLPLVLVMHSNHPQEISQEVVDAMFKLSQAGVRLLNQSVLLKGINDQAEILVELSERLWDARITPYYLHILDKVNGAAHFDISREAACALYRELLKQLPGYLVPKLVVEEPGAAYKVPVL